MGFRMKTRELDRFGGWVGKKFEATGFFRVEKDERWWLVTPEGNAFLSFGINHLHPEFWRQDYNREAWKKRLGLDDLNTPNSHQPSRPGSCRRVVSMASIRRGFTQSCRSSITLSHRFLICRKFFLSISRIGSRKCLMPIFWMYFQTNSPRTVTEWRRKLQPLQRMTFSCSVTL